MANNSEIPMLRSPMHHHGEPEDPRSKKMWRMLEKMAFLPNPDWREWEKRNPPFCDQAKSEDQ